MQFNDEYKANRPQWKFLRCFGVLDMENLPFVCLAIKIVKYATLLVWLKAAKWPLNLIKAFSIANRELMRRLLYRLVSSNGERFSRGSLPKAGSTVIIGLSVLSSVFKPNAQAWLQALYIPDMGMMSLMWLILRHFYRILGICIFEVWIVCFYNGEVMSIFAEPILERVGSTSDWKKLLLTMLTESCQSHFSFSISTIIKFCNDFLAVHWKMLSNVKIN